MIKSTCWIAVMALFSTMLNACTDGGSIPNLLKPTNQLLVKSTKDLTCEGTKIAVCFKHSSLIRFTKLSEIYNDGYLDQRDNRACYAIA